MVRFCRIVGVYVGDGYLAFRNSAITRCERYGVANSLATGVAKECSMTDYGRFGFFRADSEMNL
ncbi:hypothetical protein KJ815_10775 [bacterium]|nr:hypothetical protein [bacterium]